MVIIPRWINSLQDLDVSYFLCKAKANKQTVLQFEADTGGNWCFREEKPMNAENNKLLSRTHWIQVVPEPLSTR